MARDNPGPAAGFLSLDEQTPQSQAQPSVGPVAAWTT